MNKLCTLLNKSEDEIFELITTGFKSNLYTWDYFVNWEKVMGNITPIEHELNLLNYIIGKEDIKHATIETIKKYPEVIKVFPLLLAIRGNSFDILTDTENFIYRNYDFTARELDDEEINQLSEYIIQSGFGDLLKDKRVKNLVDYATGVEVGLDSNGRKNRGGTAMENIVEQHVMRTCKELELPYMIQATATKIKRQWGIDIAIGKSSRKIDFAINKNGKLYFIETNFYGGGGSKLKSTATEYIKMNEYWNLQGIEFIWITDGAGWKSTLKPLREYFNSSDYLLNLEMLKENILFNIISI